MANVKHTGPAAFMEKNESADLRIRSSPTLAKQFGTVAALALHRDQDAGQLSGSALVNYASAHSASIALSAMGGGYFLPGAAQPLQGAVAPMSVTWTPLNTTPSDPSQKPRRRGPIDPNQENHMLFFAKVQRAASEEEVRIMFSRFGKVYEVNLFRAYQGATTSKGCGLVTLGSHEEAMAAIDALNNKYMWAGMESHMVVKWMDAALQRRRREQHLVAIKRGLKTAADGSGVLGGITSLSLQEQAALAMRLHGPPGSLHLGGMGMGSGHQQLVGSGLNGGGMSVDMSGGESDPNENPPVGCNPDAIKLFIGNVPKSFTEEQLCPFFETAGQVKELVIIRDKATQESKGSAFVWYTTRAQAERAILEFNLRHVLPDPTGQHDRPLVVRRAKSRAKGLGGGSPTPGSIHPSIAMLTQASNPSYLDNSSLASAAGFYGGLGGATQQQQLMQQMMGGGNGLDGLHSMNHLGQQHQPQMLQGGGLMGFNGRGGSNNGLGSNYSNGLLQSLGLPQYGNGGNQHNNIYDNLGLSDPLMDQYAGLTNQDQGHYNNSIAEQLQNQSHQLQQQQQNQSQQLALPLSPLQLGAVSNHLFSLQAVTGAQLHISSGAPNMFTLLIVGNITQIHTAWNLVTSIISGAPM